MLNSLSVYVMWVSHGIALPLRCIHRSLSAQFTLRSPNDMEPCKIEILLDTTTVEPGRLLMGRVRITVASSIKKAELHVKMSCVEELGWNEGIAQQSIVRGIQYQHEHFSTGLHLLGNGTELQPGTYEHPFRFSVPVQIPGSFKHERPQALSLLNMGMAFFSVLCRMVHKVTATMVIDGRLEAPLLVTEDFIVPSVSAKAMPVVVETTQDLHSFGMIKKGTSHLTVELLTAAVSPKDTIKVSIRLNNESAKLLRKVKLVLFEDLDVNGQAVPRDTLVPEPRKICSKMFKGKIIAPVCQGQSVTLEMPIDTGDSMYSPVLAPSVHGHFLGFKYRVVVECDLSWTRDIAVTLPLEMTASRDDVIAMFA